MALKLDADPGDSIRIGANTLLRIERKTGQRTRLSIESNEDIEQFKAGEKVPALAPPARNEVAAPPPAAKSEQEPLAILRRG